MLITEACDNDICSSIFYRRAFVTSINHCEYCSNAWIWNVL